MLDVNKITKKITKVIFTKRLIISVLGLSFSALVYANSDKFVIDPPAEGSVTPAQGLEAWQRIYEVTSHPRCANCHVGKDNIPMWSGPSYGKTRPHGMNIHADTTRVGAKSLVCSTCHIKTKDLHSEKHAPPHHGMDWALAPVEFEWFDKTSKEICEQIKDPDRNGGRESYLQIAEHLQHDASQNGPVLWGWNPGGDREPAPYSLQEHIDDVLSWGVAGSPCPEK